MSVAFGSEEVSFFQLRFSMAAEGKRGRPQWEQGRPLFENAYLHIKQGFLAKHARAGDTVRDTVVGFHGARDMDELHTSR